MKQCSTCKTLKPFDQFYRCAEKKDGYKHQCKACERLYHQTEKAKISHKASCLKYQRTEKGKIASRANCAKFRKNEAFKKSTLKYRAKFPERRSAQIAVCTALHSGILVKPENCTCCNAQCIPEGHHTDYTKPLQVIWLCKDCHEAAHHPS